MDVQAEERDTKGSFSPGRGLDLAFYLSPVGTGPAGLLQAGVWLPPRTTCLLCAPHQPHSHASTLHPLCHLASERGQDYSRSLFTEEEIETHRRGAFAQRHTLRIRAYKSHESEWDLSPARGHTPLGLHLLPPAIPSLNTFRCVCGGGEGRGVGI